MLTRSPAAPHRAGGERREGSEARAGRGRGAGCPGGGTRAAAGHAQGYVWRDGQGVLAARGGVWLVHLVGEVRLLHAEAGVQQAQVCHRDPTSQRHRRAAHRPRAYQQHSGAQRHTLPPWLRARACVHTPPPRQDTIVRWRRMGGYEALWVPGALHIASIPSRGGACLLSLRRGRDRPCWHCDADCG